LGKEEATNRPRWKCQKDENYVVSLRPNKKFISEEGMIKCYLIG
jgi:hypothetical protein